jgi:hypothetical protein
MWVFTTDGFISCVRQGDRVAVRARERETLEALDAAYPDLMSGDVDVSSGTDYRYRTFVTPHNFALLMASLAADVDYPNFKAAVLERQGKTRYERALHEVWTAMARTQPGGPYGDGGGRVGYPPIPSGERE